MWLLPVQQLIIIQTGAELGLDFSTFNISMSTHDCLSQLYFATLEIVLSRNIVYHRLSK